MASGLRSHEMVSENLKKQLAFAVRTIQWSYGIFWSISGKQPGVLEWGEGYYNGDIKTRKTVQSVEFNSDRMAFQRSDQLKELYESLSAGEANPHARRLSAALSPEDLTDLEWYYLVCMSFVFNVGQGLPGRSLATGESIWLRNAHYADTKVFGRSLLAKSASIQTVVCFPYLGGVIELGVSEMVMEDPGLIQLAKNSLSNSKDVARDIFDGQLVTFIGCEELETFSLNNSSSDFEGNQILDDSFLVGGASHVQSLQFMDDEFRNCVNSSDCISQTVDPDKGANDKSAPDLQESVHEEMPSIDDLHFHNVLSSLLKSSHPLILGSRFRISNKESSFVSWRNVGFEIGQKPITRGSQKVLKKVLLDVPRMHEDGLWKLEYDEFGARHGKIGKLDERFSILKTLVPSACKVDKVSILDTTIEYLKNLEKRVEELGPSKEITRSEGRAKRKPEDTSERTSGNYGKRMTTVSKRKAIDIDNEEPELSCVIPVDDLSIKIDDGDVKIDMRCPWREGLLLEIIDAVSSLRLDSHSVRSSTEDGFLTLNIKSKAKEAATMSTTRIRQVLHRFTTKIARI